jgi:hypothetical protein
LVAEADYHTDRPEHLVLGRGTVVLKAIDHSVLAVSGSDDIMLPDSDAYLMFKQLKSAQLILPTRDPSIW